MKEVYEWKDARLWAFIKLTGRWPGSKQSGGRASTATLPFRPFSSQPDISVTHALLRCPGTRPSFLESPLSRSSSMEGFVCSLFHISLGPDLDVARIGYVGKVIRQVLQVVDQ